MATLEIRRKTNKVWQHFSSDLGTYIVSKMYCKTNGDIFKIVEHGGSQRGEYDFSDVTIYDDVNSGSAETFESAELLMKRLEALSYVGFYYDGEVLPANLISTDASNNITLGTDGNLFSSGGGGGSTDWSDLTNFASLTSATLPLAGTEELAIVQGGETKKVAASNLGGGGASLKTKSYEYHIQYNFAATTDWFNLRYNALGSNRPSPVWEIGNYNGTVLLPSFRGWGDVLMYKQQVENITIRSLRMTNDLKFRVIYYELSAGVIVNEQMITEFTVLQEMVGVNKDIVELSVTPFTMQKNGIITIVAFDNNLACNVANLSIYINTTEVL